MKELHYFVLNDHDKIQLDSYWETKAEAEARRDIINVGLSWIWKYSVQATVPQFGAAFGVCKNIF